MLVCVTDLRGGGGGLLNGLVWLVDRFPIFGSWRGDPPRTVAHACALYQITVLLRLHLPRKPFVRRGGKWLGSVSSIHSLFHTQYGLLRALFLTAPCLSLPAPSSLVLLDPQTAAVVYMSSYIYLLLTRGRPLCPVCFSRLPLSSFNAGATPLSLTPPPKKVQKVIIITSL